MNAKTPRIGARERREIRMLRRRLMIPCFRPRVSSWRSLLFDGGRVFDPRVYPHPRRRFLLADEEADRLGERVVIDPVDVRTGAELLAFFRALDDLRVVEPEQPNVAGAGDLDVRAVGVGHLPVGALVDD